MMLIAVVAILFQAPQRPSSNPCTAGISCAAGLWNGPTGPEIEAFRRIVRLRLREAIDVSTEEVVR
jgi:hypothetical protein